jgi:hypothetical protein
MASFNFNATQRTIVDNFYGSGSFKMMLVSVLPGETQKDSWAFRSDVTNEVTGAGYTAGGAAVTLTVAATDNPNNDVEVTSSAATWASSTITAVAGIIYKDTGVAATSPVVACVDFGGTVSSTNGTFTATPSGSIKYQN